MATPVTQSLTGQTPSGDAGRSPFSDKVGTAASVSGLSVREHGSGSVRETVLYMNAMPFTITEVSGTDHGAGGLLLYTFPLGLIHFQDSICNFVANTTSDLEDTLNTGKTVNFGLGTVINTATTPIATTQIDLLPGYAVTPPTFTSSVGTDTTITTAATAAKSFLQPAATVLGPPLLRLNGTTTAIKLHLNMDVPTANDIDADATLSITGWIKFNWVLVGAYATS